jgi:hypothetical protein
MAIDRAMQPEILDYMDAGIGTSENPLRFGKPLRVVALSCSRLPDHLRPVGNKPRGVLIIKHRSTVYDPADRPRFRKSVFARHDKDAVKSRHDCGHPNG